MVDADHRDPLRPLPDLLGRRVAGRHILENRGGRQPADGELRRAIQETAAADAAALVQMDDVHELLRIVRRLLSFHVTPSGRSGGALFCLLCFHR